VDANIQTVGSEILRSGARGGMEAVLKIHKNLLKMGCREFPFADNEQNASTIQSDNDYTAYSLVENLSNSIDAIGEFSVQKHGISPQSLSEITKFLGVPEGKWSGQIMGQSDLTRATLRKRWLDEWHDKIIVAVTDGKSFSYPNIWFCDRGIGLTTQEFSDTIMALHGGSKYHKPYTMGMFHHGGAMSLEASPKCTVVMARKDVSLLKPGEPDVVTFTIVRRVHSGSSTIPAMYKVLKDKNGKWLTIPADQVKMPDFISAVDRMNKTYDVLDKAEEAASLAEGRPINLDAIYTDEVVRWKPNFKDYIDFPCGVVKVQFDCEIQSFHDPGWRMSRDKVETLFNHLNTTLTDPSIPATFIDLRDSTLHQVDEKGEKGVNRPSLRRRKKCLGGLRAYLLSHYKEALKGKAHNNLVVHTMSDMTTQCRLYEDSDTLSNIRIEAFVAPNKKKQRGDFSLRNVARYGIGVVFIGPGGQSLHTEAPHFFSGTGSPLAPLGGLMLVLVHLQDLPTAALGQVFTSNRHLKSGGARTRLMATVKNALYGDDKLKTEAQRLRDEYDKISNSESIRAVEGALKKGLRDLDRLMRQPVVREDNKTRKPFEAHESGQPTFIKILNPKRWLLPGRSMRLHLGSDIPDKYEFIQPPKVNSSPRVTLQTEKLPVFHGPFVGGHAIINVPVKKSLKPGTVVTISVMLHLDNGTTLSSKDYEFEVADATGANPGQKKPPHTPGYREYTPLIRPLETSGDLMGKGMAERDVVVVEFDHEKFVIYSYINMLHPVLKGVLREAKTEARIKQTKADYMAVAAGNGQVASIILLDESKKDNTEARLLDQSHLNAAIEIWSLAEIDRIRKDRKLYKGQEEKVEGFVKDSDAEEALEEDSDNLASIVDAINDKKNA